MDRHEKGIERIPRRLDQPLPEWQGSYRGDARRLPKVVQKLLLGRMLGAEEKAELLWRLFELDQKARARQARVRAVALTVAVVGIAAYMTFFQREWIVEQVMAWLSPPAAPPV